MTEPPLDLTIPPNLAPERLRELELELSREEFSVEVLTELVGFLQRVLGKPETASFIDALGQRVGETLHARYRGALGTDALPAALLPAVLTDLKRRIGGTFRIAEVDGDRIVLTNGRCPFGERVRGRPALCRMTSNVFGTIVADAQGYARVELDETIAEGDPGCRVVVRLAPDRRSDEADGDRVREYFAAPGPDDVAPR